MAIGHLNHLVARIRITHDLRIQNVKLGKIKIVVISIQQLIRILLVHAGTSEPDATIASLDGCLTHVEITEGQVVIQLLRGVFGGISPQKLRDGLCV
jgi:hypothetical protein